MGSSVAKRIAAAGVEKHWGDANWETRRNQSLVPPPALSPSGTLLVEPTNDPASRAEMGFAESQPQHRRAEVGLVLQDSNETGIICIRQYLLQYVFGVHLTPVCI